MAHGLNTSYWEFREFLEKEDANFLYAFEALYNINPLDDTEPWYTEAAQKRWNTIVDKKLWSKFEQVIGEPDTTAMIGLSDAVTEGMPSVGIRHHMDLYWEKEFGFISKMHDYIRRWIESIDTSNVSCKKKSLFKSDAYFLNFNYTDILEKSYCIRNVLHIHGGVNTICDISPIIGHCNKNDIRKHREWAKEADDKFFEAQASVLDAVANYLETIYKDSTEIIINNQDFFEKISNVENICVFGWSGGDADRPYLKEIIQNVSDVKWNIYWYNEDDYKKLCSIFEEEGIKGNNIEYIPSSCFWDECEL